MIGSVMAKQRMRKVEEHKGNKSMKVTKATRNEDRQVYPRLSKNGLELEGEIEWKWR